MAFASIYPEKKYIGLDWAFPSQKIIAEIQKVKGFDIEGLRIDMFHPKTAPTVVPGSAVFTIGAMEQLGNSYGNFADYLMEQDVESYVHIEPIIELHPRNTLMGYLGAKYMEKRGYLNGYLDSLHALEKEGKITISHCRPLIGSTHLNGWCLIAWKKTG